MKIPLEGFRAKFEDLIRLLTTTLLAISLLLEWGGMSFLLEKFTHFKVQYSFLFLMAGLTLVLLGNFRWASLAFLGFCMNVIPVYQFCYRDPGSPPSNRSTKLKILHFNVLTSNQNYAACIAAILAKEPDILGLVETSQQWLDHLKALDTLYPYAHKIPRDDNFGITLFSKHRLLNTREESFGHYATPTIISEVELDNQIITVILTHPLPPIERQYFHGRNEQMRGLADFIQHQQLPTILIGDLNMTPWSPYFLKFIQNSGMVASSQGFGWNATWPQFPLFKIPIDHILTSKNCQTISFEVLGANGSDHNSILAVISLPPKD